MRPQIVDHFFHAADVDIHVASGAEGFEDVCLHTVGTGLPGGAGARERGPVIEIRPVCSQRPPLLVVKQACFVPHAKDQREVPVCSLAEIRKQHGPKGRNAGAGRDEDGIRKRLLRDKCAVGTLKVDFVARFQVEQKRREVPFAHQIGAQRKTVPPGRRSYRVRPRDLLIANLLGDGKELTGDKSSCPIRRFELKVAGARGQLSGAE